MKRSRFPEEQIIAILRQLNRPALLEGKTLGELPVMEQTQNKKTSMPYSLEFCERAVRLFMEHRDKYQSEAAALTAIAGKLGCSPDSLRVWARQVQRDGGERPGQTSEEKARITLSSGHGKDVSGFVVMTRLPRTTHFMPKARINRSTLQGITNFRAFLAKQIGRARTTETPSLGAKNTVRRISGVKTIKAELIWRRSWETRRQAETAIFQYINGFYNPRRRHSALGWKSPVAFEHKVA